MKMILRETALLVGIVFASVILALGVRSFIRFQNTAAERACIHNLRYMDAAMERATNSLSKTR
jgi:hypothetical protein